MTESLEKIQPTKKEQVPTPDTSEAKRVEALEGKRAEEIRGVIDLYKETVAKKEGELATKESERQVMIAKAGGNERSSEIASRLNSIDIEIGNLRRELSNAPAALDYALSDFGLSSKDLEMSENETENQPLDMGPVDGEIQKEESEIGTYKLATPPDMGPVETPEEEIHIVTPEEYDESRKQGKVGADIEVIDNSAERKTIQEEFGKKKPIVEAEVVTKVPVKEKRKVKKSRDIESSLREKMQQKKKPIKQDGGRRDEMKEMNRLEQRVFGKDAKEALRENEEFIRKMRGYEPQNTKLDPERRENRPIRTSNEKLDIPKEKPFEQPRIQEVSEKENLSQPILDASEKKLRPREVQPTVQEEVNYQLDKLEKQQPDKKTEMEEDIIIPGNSVDQAEAMNLTHESIDNHTKETSEKIDRFYNKRIGDTKESYNQQIDSSNSEIRKLEAEKAGIDRQSIGSDAQVGVVERQISNIQDRIADLKTERDQEMRQLMLNKATEKEKVVGQEYLMQEKMYERNISHAESLDELEQIVGNIRILRGSEGEYTGKELQNIVDQIRHRELTPATLTSAAGLYEKFMELFQKEHQGAIDNNTEAIRKQIEDLYGTDAPSEKVVIPSNDIETADAFYVKPKGGKGLDGLDMTTETAKFESPEHHRSGEENRAQTKESLGLGLEKGRKENTMGGGRKKAKKERERMKQEAVKQEEKKGQNKKRKKKKDKGEPGTGTPEKKHGLFGWFFSKLGEMTKALLTGKVPKEKK